MNSSEKMAKLIEIQKARGSKAKSFLLEECPELCSVLKACYDPYLQFYISPKDNWATQIGTATFDQQTSKLLGKLSKRVLSGYAAKDAVIEELNRLDVLSQELLTRILNKDMRIGMGPKTINKVYNDLIPVFPVQLARLYEASKAEWPCMASYKIDGLRCIWEDGQMYSRKGHKLRGLEHIAEELKKWGMARIDGELTVPGMMFDELSGNIRAFKKSDNAVYNVFDVSPSADIGYPLVARLDIIKCLRPIDNVRIVQHYRVDNEKQAMAMYAKAKEEGYEGLMLKKNRLYFDDRNHDWMKLKPKDTVDVEVIAIEEGQGRNELRCGALVCDFNGVTIHVGGGLSDAQRIAWFNDPSLIVGKTIEVDYMEISKNGALRHPRLKYVRGDK